MQGCMCAATCAEGDYTIRACVEQCRLHVQPVLRNEGIRGHLCSTMGVYEGHL